MQQDTTLRDRLEQERRRCAVLIALVQRLAHPPNIRTAIEIVGYSIAEVIPFNVCTHVLLEQGKVNVYLYIQLGTSPDVVERAKRQTLDSQHITHLLLPDTPKDEYSFGSANPDIPPAKALSYLEAPLKRGGKVIGLVSNAFATDTPYTDDDQKFLNVISEIETIAFRRYQTSRESEWQRMETLVHDMELGVVILEADSRVVVANPKALAVFGRAASETLTTDDIIKFFGAESFTSLLKDCLASRKTVEIKHMTADEEFVYHVFVSPIETGGVAREARGAAFIFEDITEEKLLERSKSEFVAIASHQLRTPLTVIKGNTEMLLDENFGALNADQRDMLTQTATGNERLIRLVNDMLDIGRIERQTMPLKIERVDLDALTRSIAKDLGSVADEKHVKISVKTEGTIPSVRADELRLRQVIQNLIDNAIRYSKPENGHITITCRLRDRRVETAISDNGIGIPLAEQKKIFQRFYRASNAVKTVGGGTGLGLFIVKSMIEQLGGTISFTSRLNKGTDFLFTLPVA